MGIIVLFVFIACSFYVQTRGKVKHISITRRITDPANLFSPVNCLFYAFSKHKNTAFIDTKHFPEVKTLEDNWEVIRDEAISLNNESHIKASNDLDDIGFNSFFRRGWKRFYLKWYGANLNSAKKLCPKTVALLSAIPSVKGAMFAMLPPGAKLNAHRDPYAGSYRYHLGLVTPNSDDCFICVDDEFYSWRDGKAVMFDETYMHNARNNTEHNRIILFLDVERPVTFVLIKWINKLFSSLVLSAAATKNSDGDKVGLLNKVFSHLHLFGAFNKKLKNISEPIYYIVQYSFYLLLIYLIFL